LNTFVQYESSSTAIPETKRKEGTNR